MKSRISVSSQALLLGAALLISTALPPIETVHARAEDYIPDDIAKKPDKKPDKKKKKETKKDGWFPTLQVAFGFAFSQSQGVVGVPDGVSIALGLQLLGGLTFRYQTHEWITSLRVIHTQSKVPNIEPFVKSADELVLSTLYQYRFPRVRWLGVFGGVRLITPLLPGSLIPLEDTNIDKTPDDVTDPYDIAAAQKAYRLTKPFSPLFLKQFAGALTQPATKKWLNVDIRLGIGGVQAFTRDGYVVADDEATAGVLELKALQDYQQAGVELQLSVTGVAVKKLLTYSFQAELMYPFVTSPHTDLSGAELINAEFRLNLGIKLWKWASLNYSLAVLRIPMIQEEWQVTNSLMLTITATVAK
ncbi:MAG: hypothetical protein ABI333_15675 [bacterium]